MTKPKTARECVHQVLADKYPHGGYIEPEDTKPLTDAILTALREAGWVVVPVAKLEDGQWWLTPEQLSERFPDADDPASQR